MKANKEYLTQLVLFDISGKIREDEKVILKEMIRDDQEAADLYTQLYATWHKDPLQAADTNWGPSEIWKAIHNRRRQRLVSGGVKALTAIATIIVVWFGIRFIQIRKAIIPPILAESGHVHMQFSGGQIIDLTKEEGEVKTTDVSLYNQHKQLRFPVNNSTQYATITVPAGKDYVVQLPDGSEIQLNAESQLLFPLQFTGASREVTINGEAYMKIAQKAAQPFIVHVGDVAIQVLGTEFNVSNYDSTCTKIALVEGSTRIHTDDGTILLKPGEASSIATGKPPTVYRFDPEDVLSWRQGLHLFNKASVEEVAQLIHRFYGIMVVLDLKPTRTSAFTGSFDRNKPIANFLEGLKFARFLNYHFDRDSTLHLIPL